MRTRGLDEIVVLVASAPCGLRDRIVEDLKSADATVLVAGSHSSAARLLRVFVCHAVVCIIGSPTEGLRSLPSLADELRDTTRDAPHFVAIDAGSGSGEPIAGFDAVLAVGIAGLPAAVRLKLLALAVER